MTVGVYASFTPGVYTSFLFVNKLTKPMR